MNTTATLSCHCAMDVIMAGDYGSAISHLRTALKNTTNPRAWSKIMLAIRELSRIAPESEGTAQ